MKYPVGWQEKGGISSQTMEKNCLKFFIARRYDQELHWIPVEYMNPKIRLHTGDYVYVPGRLEVRGRKHILVTDKVIVLKSGTPRQLTLNLWGR